MYIFVFINRSFYKSQDDTKNILDKNPLNLYNSNKKEKKIIS